MESGLKRKTNSMVKNIEAMTNIFPEEDLESGFYHFHLPVSQIFIDSRKTPVGIRRKCIQTMIDRTLTLINLKLSRNYPIRVVGLITLPELWHSQIIIFFGNSYWETFFEREDEYQKWIPLGEEDGLKKNWKVDMPNSFKVKGYKEIIKEEETYLKSDLWFFGELE